MGSINSNSKNIAVLFSGLPGAAQHSWLETGRFFRNNLCKKVRFFAYCDHRSDDIEILYLKKRMQKFKYALALFIYHNKNILLKSRYGILFKYNPNVIHFINVQIYPKLKPLVNLDKQKLVFTFRGYDILVRPNKDTEWAKFIQIIFNDGSILHFVSNYIKDKAISMGANPNKCITIYQSVDTDFFKPSFINTKSLIPQLISVGRLTWEKGYIYALEALYKVKSRGYIFNYHIYGDGNDWSLLQYHINRLNLDNCCFLKGSADREAIKEKLDASDIFIHPSLSDALPNAILEASAMELPIISTTVGGIPEAVMDNITGFLSPPCDSEIIAINIIRLLNDHHLRSKMGKEGRKHVMSKFTKEIELKKWKKIYFQD